MMLINTNKMIFIKYTQCVNRDYIITSLCKLFISKDINIRALSAISKPATLAYHSRRKHHATSDIPVVARSLCA